MPSSLVTSLLLPGYGEQPLVAEVLGADATATTYLLNCPPGTDSNDCGTYNNSITLGPWASKTLPPGAAKTGEFDVYITMPGYEEPWEFSMHCEMSRTIPEKCTSINNGGNNDGSPTVTLYSSDGLEDFEFEYAPVTITSGLELLTASRSGSQKAGATTDAQSADDDASATGTETSSSVATPENTSGASSRLTRVFGAMSVAALAAALMMS
ncbi:hypothetical protein FZEAL_7272 [Fusarium zealandicum]|uniref:GPI anchored protein n=1 Tax=Fusarium zealandicum TaxID=1053134 RepID=A0A8H4XHZ6_9HYPO|nr:hypothetical protein FZEAL_7272 [Fusarium zealandicum]